MIHTWFYLFFMESWKKKRPTFLEMDKLHSSSAQKMYTSMVVGLLRGGGVEGEGVTGEPKDS